ncbi:MAG TPA: pilus assembly protein PilM [Candidatus Acidoferrum sp.]|nr:pilus assembly protein PilM [Candidatus Acidoferrum sp.]
MLEANGRRLTRHAEVMIPDGALADGMPTPLLTAAVRSALESGAFSATEARIAIAETGTAYRDFALPSVPASELNRAVIFEGRRLIPMEATDVYFAWHASRDRDGWAVYLVAARRDMIDALVAVIGSAGLRVERMDLKPLALARGAGIPDGLVLEWGAAEATLVLMVRGRPRFFRTFQVDAAPDDVDAQLDELTLSLNALVKFMRGAAPEVAIGPSTTLALAGRFAFLADGLQRAQERFPFTVVLPSTGFSAAAGFPWQAHLAGIGLLQQDRWHSRLTPSQGGDIRVAA